MSVTIVETTLDDDSNGYVNMNSEFPLNKTDLTLFTSTDDMFNLSAHDFATHQTNTAAYRPFEG
jgi:hypothetical protein